MIRNVVKNWLLARDAIVSRPPGQFSAWEVKLRKARDRGLRLESALDGGAANGVWTRQFKRIYPDARVLAVDPRDDVQPELQQLAREHSGVTVAQTLLGDRAGEVEFHVASDQSSMLPDSDAPAGSRAPESSGAAGAGRLRKAPITTIDALIRSTSFPWPQLIKLDLQGAEMIALRGAADAMRHADALLLELSFFRLQKGAPLAAEMIAFLQERAFRLYDIAGLWHRPLDGALAQGDFLFLRDGHPLLADERWSNGS
jgi:FkbM family methyltransferase